MPIIFKIKGGGPKRPLARVGDHHACHQICKEGVHGGGPIYMGSPKVTANGQAIARVGDKAHCLIFHDEITGGVPGLLIDGKPAAAVKSDCDHGGMVTQGSPNIFIMEYDPAEVEASQQASGSACAARSAASTAQP